MKKERVRLTKAQREVLIALACLGRRIYHSLAAISEKRASLYQITLTNKRLRYEGIAQKICEELSRMGYCDQIGSGRPFYKATKKGKERGEEEAYSDRGPYS